MAKLDYNEIKPRKYIVYNGDPYEILESQVSRTQQRKPQNQVKMRNLLNGKVIPIAFHTNHTVEEADISRANFKFLYENRGEYWFCEVDNPSKRFQISADVLAEKTKFLKTNATVEALIFTPETDEETVIGIDLPIKITFKITECPPNVRGNTASSGSGKLATIETGAKINVPLFIELGEEIVVNTGTGEYVERAK